MKISYKKITVIVLWAAVFIFLYRKGLITTDIDKIRDIIGSQPSKMMMLFALMSVLRVLFFVPGVIFMVLGGICFGFKLGFVLSLLTLVVSEILVYIIGRYFIGKRLYSYLKKNYQELVLLTNRYGYGFLALGILCPVIPTDAVCLIAAMFNFNFKKYTITVFAANAPLVFLYSYLSGSSLEAVYVNIIMAIALVSLTIYTIIVWNRLRAKSHEPALKESDPH